MFYVIKISMYHSFVFNESFITSQSNQPTHIFEKYNKKLSFSLSLQLSSTCELSFIYQYLINLLNFHHYFWDIATIMKKLKFVANLKFEQFRAILMIKFHCSHSKWTFELLQVRYPFP